MKRFRDSLFLLLTIVTLDGLSASIEWDYLQMSGGDSFSPNTYRIGFSPYIVLHKVNDSIGGSVSLIADNGTYMEFGSVIVSAVVGDVVSSSYISGKDSYFYNGPVSKDGKDFARTDYSLTLKAGEFVYLAYATTLIDDVENYYYGWLRIELRQNGVLELGGSAIGLDGQAMVVGATPEPSTSALLLLGCAGLLLRRRRPTECLLLRWPRLMGVMVGRARRARRPVQRSSRSAQALPTNTHIIHVHHNSLCFHTTPFSYNALVMLVSLVSIV